MTGSESGSAKRMRKLREAKKTSQCDSCVTDGDGCVIKRDIEKEKDIDKELEKEKDKELDNKKKDKRKSTEKVPPVFFPFDDKLNQTFIDYLEMRKAIKKPATARAITLAVKKLDTLSAGDNDKAIAILEQSILSNWQDIYPLKKTYAAARKSYENNDGTIDWDRV